MGKDKAMLEYHGQSQLSFGCALLSRHCGQVFISNRAEQSAHQQLTEYHYLHDRFLGFGPLGGILTALCTYPDTAWLIIACDLPFLNDTTLDYLINQRQSERMATVFESVHNHLPEPLCAIYEPHCRHSLLQHLGNGVYCPRKILMMSDIELVKLPHARALENVNTPEEYRQTIAALT
jgi:molybdopterin-guanine dinucleotide biosynthesis protein A